MTQEWLDTKTVTRFRFPRAPKQAEGEQSVQEDTCDSEAKDDAEADDGAEEDGAEENGPHEEEEEADVEGELSQEFGDDDEVEKAAGLFASIRKEAKDSHQVARRWEEELEAYEARRAHAAGDAAVKGASGVAAAVAGDARTRVSGDCMYGQTRKSEDGTDGWSKKLSERDSEHAPLASEEMRRVIMCTQVAAGPSVCLCVCVSARAHARARARVYTHIVRVTLRECRQASKAGPRAAARGPVRGNPSRRRLLRV